MVVYGKHIVELILLKYQYLIENIYLAKEVDKSFFGLLKKQKNRLLSLMQKRHKQWQEAEIIKCIY